jgi:ATP-dependent Clp protease ATP-binding subunit ClpA
MAASGRAIPKGVLEKISAPEFRDRLSATIEFAPLSPATMERVVDKFIAEL